MDDWAALAALDWQVELGADEAILDAPVDRYALVPEEKPAPAAAPGAAPVPIRPAEVDAVAVATEAASRAQSLDQLRGALEAFELCDLKQGARQTVFCDGNPAARVMIVGEAPGRDEDRQGKPFVGRAGHLLDRMLGAIDLSREAQDAARAVYISNVVVWRPPQNRDPSAEEIAMMRPFITRHIELAAPDLLVVMGNIACDALLGRRGITRMRGQWDTAVGRPVLPMFHPAYLLRNPEAKREAWADLLSLKAKLEGA
nr:uracil-DNA glycosylase [Mesobacterium pallidum]